MFIMIIELVINSIFSMHTHPRSLTRMHAYMHARTHTPAHTHTHTHTHTHRVMFEQPRKHAVYYLFAYITGSIKELISFACISETT